MTVNQVSCGPGTGGRIRLLFKGERLGSRTFAGHAKAGPIIRAAPIRAAGRA
jgi:hypothetical protein